MRALEGRRIWFVGIGGAGLSAYAFLARAWGAEIGGWDRVDTPYLRALDGVEVVISDEPVVREGWEAVVSSAYPAVAGTSRAEFLAELVSLRRAIVVGGAHGKTTTTAMIAYVLAELGLDPAWLVGGELPQLGGNAGAGEGWLVVEGDESDRTLERLRPEIGVVTNVDLDHHSTFSSEAEVAALFERLARGVAARGARLGARAGELRARRSRASTTAGTRPRRSRRSSSPASRARTRSACWRGSAARGGGSSWSARRGGVTVVDDYAHHPSELDALLAAARESMRRAACSSSSSRTSTPARGISRSSSAPRSSAADAVCVTEIYRAREEPIEGVGGKLVVDALRPGVRAGWAPSVEDGVRLVASWARPGDLVLTVGRGRRRAGRAARARGARVKIEEGVPLARLTTIGTGGPARAFARPATLARARGGARVGGASATLGVATVGLGSNLLAADEGVDALVLRLGGELAAARVDGELLVAGGGATNAVCLHHARDAGLGGFEFACAIPGTAGGGVWMNAGAYGSDWAAILVRARVVTADGAGWLTPAELGLSYRHSELRHGQVVAEVEFRLEPRPPDEIKATVARARRAAEGDAADEQAHVRQRVQEPGARARRRPDARALRAEGPPDRRRGDLAEARELHRERGRRDDRRRARADGRGAAPRARAVRRRARARGRVPRAARAAAAALTRARDELRAASASAADANCHTFATNALHIRVTCSHSVSRRGTGGALGGT